MIAMKLLTLAIKLLHVRMNYLDQACDSISYSGMNRQRFATFSKAHDESYQLQIIELQIEKRIID